MMGIQKKNSGDQVMISIEEFVPQDHFLRHVESTIDFSFIEEKLKPSYYEDNGRPSIHPISLFKMMFIGYFYGIRSEQQLDMNLAYRWFLGISLSGSVPHHSTMSLSRRTRFLHTSIFEDIFDEIVRQAQNHNIVGGRILMTDSTHIKASANKNKFVRKLKVARPKAKAYLYQLEKEVNEDRSPMEKRVETTKGISGKDIRNMPDKTSENLKEKPFTRCVGIQLNGVSLMCQGAPCF
ncbi:hypothetical protein CVD28_13445 [Bacillus sp. M6-12]|nr:hypothetical protein CVD28_13445 [Bacillus sp. M6-12]